ncbi:unnamed protein product, partial [marine sediment metagenome]
MSTFEPNSMSPMAYSNIFFWEHIHDATILSDSDSPLDHIHGEIHSGQNCLVFSHLLT